MAAGLYLASITGSVVGGTSFTIAKSIPGNGYVGLMFISHPSGPVASVTDDGGNRWRLAGGGTSGAAAPGTDRALEAWVCPNIAAAITSITVTLANSGNAAATAFIISGADNASPIRNFLIPTNVVTAATTGTATTSGSNSGNTGDYMAAAISYTQATAGTSQISGITLAGTSGGLYVANAGTTGLAAASRALTASINAASTFTINGTLSAGYGALGVVISAAPTAQANPLVTEPAALPHANIANSSYQYRGSTWGRRNRWNGSVADPVPRVFARPGVGQLWPRGSNR